MSKLEDYKFSKIGTNPYKYFDNFYIYLNRLPIGEMLKIDLTSFQVIHEEIEILRFNSSTTLRQNIDAWIWMGLIIKKDKNTIIKIINNDVSKNEMLEYIKYYLLIDNNNQLVNKHKKTIITKLLTLKNQKSANDKYTYEEIIKECGKFEQMILKDSSYIKILEIKWGKNENI